MRGLSTPENDQMTYFLRLAHPGDLDTVGAITAAAYLDGGHIRAEAPYLADLRDAATRAEHAEVWVAVDGVEVLGSVTFVAPGSALAEVAGPSEAEVSIVLSTQPSMTAAHRIYGRLGFVRTPAKDWSPVAGVFLRTYRLGLGSGG